MLYVCDIVKMNELDTMLQSEQTIKPHFFEQISFTAYEKTCSNHAEYTDSKNWYQKSTVTPCTKQITTHGSQGKVMNQKVC